MKEIHEFAEKWIGKFKDLKINYIELVDHFMADDCKALGFKMDCGQAFKIRYGEAAHDHEALCRIIDDVDDIPLLGSAIYSQWRYFNHWAYSGAEILEPNNRAWFITALTQLSKLSESDTDKDRNIILFPEFAALKAEVERLRTEISMLLLERDELRLVVCKNIETAYMLALGGLEYKAYELHCKVLRIRKKIHIIQAKKNRQEKIVLSVIENMLDEEFAEFRRKLNEQIKKILQAIDHSKGRPLTDEETKELKKLYRTIVKALHPDLHPEVTPAQIRLFYNAVQAYEDGDLDSLRAISDTLAESVISKSSENGLLTLVKDKERLAETLNHIREEIATIKSEYPYTMKDLVNDPKQIAEKRTELEKTINELKEVFELYSKQLEEILR